MRKIAVLMATALFLFAALPVQALAAEQAVGTTLRLERTRGEVVLEDKNGRELPILEGMKLYNGNGMETADESHAYISLDSKTAVKLDTNSSAEVVKSGKKLEVQLETGKLLFNVKEPYADDEGLNIRTSTLVTGIRGTAGVVDSVEPTMAKVYILEGRVETVCTDPVTGETRPLPIAAGEYVTIKADGSGPPQVETRPLTEGDIAGFVAVEIARDPDLAGRVRAATNLDVDAIIAAAEGRLASDRQAERVRRAEIEARLAGLVNEKSVEPFFREGKPVATARGPQAGSATPTGGRTGGAAPGGSPAPAAPMPGPAPGPEREAGLLIIEEDFAAAGVGYADGGVIAAALATNGTVRVQSRTGSGRLRLDASLTVPAGKTLQFDSGLVETAPATTLLVDGTLNNYATLRAGGTLQNRSGNSVHNYGTLAAEGGLVNTDAGNFVNHPGGVMETGATVTNRGTFQNEGAFAHKSGTFTTSGAVTGGGSLTLQSGAGFTVESGSFTPSGPVSVAGAMTLRSGDGSGHYIPSGDVTVTGTGSLLIDNCILDSTGTLANAGQITLNHQMSFLLTSSAVENSGTFTLQLGGIRSRSAFAVNNTGTFRFLKGYVMANGTEADPVRGGGQFVDGADMPVSLGNSYTTNVGAVYGAGMQEIIDQSGGAAIRFRVPAGGMALPQSLVIPHGANIGFELLGPLDMGTKQITAEGHLALLGSGNGRIVVDPANPAPFVNRGSIAVTSGVWEAPQTLIQGEPAPNGDRVRLTVNGGTLIGGPALGDQNANSLIQIKGGAVKGVSQRAIVTGGSVNMTGGLVLSTDAALAIQAGGEVNITGGSVEAYAEVPDPEGPEHPPVKPEAGGEGIVPPPDGGPTGAPGEPGTPADNAPAPHGEGGGKEPAPAAPEVTLPPGWEEDGPGADAGDGPPEQ